MLRALACCCAAATTALSISLSLPALTTTISSPRRCTAAFVCSDVVLHEARIVRIHKERDPSGAGKGLMQQLQSLGDKLDSHKSRSRDVSSRTPEAGHETRADRIGGGREHDRDRLRCCHRRADSDIARACTDDGNLAADEVSRHGRQPIKLAFRPAVFDGHVAALCEARLAQAAVKSSHAVRPLRCRHAVQHADHWHCRLLRARASGHVAAHKKRDELARFMCLYSTTRNLTSSFRIWVYVTFPISRVRCRKRGVSLVEAVVLR